jgi:hypothetical protein
LEGSERQERGEEQGNAVFRRSSGRCIGKKNPGRWSTYDCIKEIWMEIYRDKNHILKA